MIVKRRGVPASNLIRNQIYALASDRFRTVNRCSIMGTCPKPGHEARLMTVDSWIYCSILRMVLHGIYRRTRLAGP